MREERCWLQCRKWLNPGREKMGKKHAKPVLRVYGEVPGRDGSDPRAHPLVGEPVPEAVDAALHLRRVVAPVQCPLVVLSAHGHKGLGGGTEGRDILRSSVHTYAHVTGDQPRTRYIRHRTRFDP